MNSDVTSLARLANHLWQSTAFVGITWLLSLHLKKNRAAVRYWLWFAASSKFFIPFSALMAIGNRLSWRRGAPLRQPSQWSFVIDNVVHPFATSNLHTHGSLPQPALNFSAILIAVWFCGVAVSVVVWLGTWVRVRHICKRASTLRLGLPIPVLSSPSSIEPGVFGVLRPVLLLPRGIESRLTAEQLDAILGHEMVHVRRRDNLTAAIHMSVETVFWFFPVVHWLRSRLVKEREQACDEEMLRQGTNAESYAQAILEVCNSYLKAPALCFSRSSGADLAERIVRIASRRFPENMTLGKRSLLSAIAGAVIVAPLVVGIADAPVRAQTVPPNVVEADALDAPAAPFKVLSVKRDYSAENIFMIRTQNGVTSITNFSVSRLIEFAYDVNAAHLLGGPDWVGSERYDIAISVEDRPSTDPVSTSKAVIRSVLASYFGLSLGDIEETDPVYALVVSADGPKFVEGIPTPSDAADANHLLPPVLRSVEMVDGQLIGRIKLKGAPIRSLLNGLSSQLGCDVVDETGLTGNYDLTLQWTHYETKDISMSCDSAGPGSLGSSAGSVSMISALREQLGLGLRETRSTEHALLIQNVVEPSEN